MTILPLFGPLRPRVAGTVLALIVIFCGIGLSGRAEPSGKVASPRAHPFDANVKVTLGDETMIVESDGIPTHKTATFPNATNPNRVLKQDYRFFIPRHPKQAETPVPTPFGPIGVAVNGIPFYNPYNREGRDAVLGPNAEVFDSCCGHPDPLGRYHYHKYPVCVKSPFQDLEGAHSPLLGYAFDGYALYGPNGEGGQPPADLDASNGHQDKERGYHYHVTAKFPYLLGAYRGVPAARNFEHRRPGGPGGPGGPPFPPPPPFVSPLLRALDTDRDGTLSAEEIAGAAKALKALDRNGDGALTPDELRPPGPGPGPGPRPGGRGPRPPGPPPPRRDGPPPDDGPPPYGPPPRGDEGPG